MLLPSRSGVIVLTSFSLVLVLPRERSRIVLPPWTSPVGGRSAPLLMPVAM